MSTPATEENNQNSNPEIYYLKNSDLEKMVWSTMEHLTESPILWMYMQIIKQMHQLPGYRT